MRLTYGPMMALIIYDPMMALPHGPMMALIDGPMVAQGEGRLLTSEVTLFGEKQLALLTYTPHALTAPPSRTPQARRAQGQASAPHPTVELGLLSCLADASDSPPSHPNPFIACNPPPPTPLPPSSG